VTLFVSDSNILTFALSHSIATNAFRVFMVDSRKVLYLEYLFLRKSQRYKGRMSHYLKIRHLCTYCDYYRQNHDDSNDVNKHDLP